MRLLISGSWVRAPRWAFFYKTTNIISRKTGSCKVQKALGVTSFINGCYCTLLQRFLLVRMAQVSCSGVKLLTTSLRQVKVIKYYTCFVLECAARERHVCKLPLYIHIIPLRENVDSVLLCSCDLQAPVAQSVSASYL